MPGQSLGFWSHFETKPPPPPPGPREDWAFYIFS